MAEGTQGEGGLRLRALRTGTSEQPEAVDASARTVARGRGGRRQDGGLPSFEPLLAGGLVRLVRRGEVLRAGPEEFLAAPGFHQHGSRRDVDAAWRSSGLAEAL